jgi:hypothetical protein
MISILLIGLATALLAFAIMAKVRANEPKKAKRAEKAEIMKQLLALSELESRTSETASSARFQMPVLSQSVRRGNVPRKSVAKTS